MDPFSYLSVLTSIILGLGIARILTGIGKMLQGRQYVRVYSVHLLWSLNLFLYIVLIWWVLYRWQSRQDWTFFLFLFLLLSPTVAFLESILLFPDSNEPVLDLKQQFFANRPWFFGLAALLPPLDALDTLLKGWDHFVSQGFIYVLTLSLVFGLSLVGLLTDREDFHKYYAVFFLVYILIFITINLRVLA